MAALASTDDLTARYDESQIRDLASDDNEPVTDLSSDTKVSTALEDGSGRLLAAALTGRHYTEADLAALTGNAGALVKRIVCDLAMAFLMGRRPAKFATEAIKAMKADAEAYLDRLRKGERTFDVEEALDAALPSVDGPTALDFKTLNLVTARTQNYYPHYSNRLPIGRG